MSPRYVVRAVRFGPRPFVVVDSTRDVIVGTASDAETADDMADALNEGDA
jgi:hypothetical protein